jgi:hypothetical protein
MASLVAFVFLFDRLSFLKWASGLLTYQRYFLPMFLYLILLMFTALLVIKLKVQWDNCPETECKGKDVRLGRDFLLPMTIRIHKWLLTFLTVMMFIYVLKTLYVFMFRTALPLMTIYIHLVRYTAIVAIIYIYLLCDCVIPMVKKGRSLERAIACFNVFLVKKWKFTIIYYANQIILIMLSIFIFRVLINWLANSETYNLLLAGEPSMLFRFVQVETIPQFLRNVMIFPLAFILSNLLFSPIVLTMRWIILLLKKRTRFA